MAFAMFAALLASSSLLFAATGQPTAPDDPTAWGGEPLAGDDECVAQGPDEAPAPGCALSALQLRGVPVEGQQPQSPTADARDASYLYEEPADVLVVNDLPAGWNDTSLLGEGDEGETDVLDEDEDGLDSLNEAATMSGHGCADRYNSRRCALYRECRGGQSYCVLGGYMIVPGRAVTGMEDINSGDAGSLDYLMNAAMHHCSGTNCVLMTNPIGHRTQDQLHLHFRYLTKGGPSLHHRLEQALCGTHGWHYFHECGAGKARIYDHFPRVFTEVAHAYGGGSLAHVGISVFFTRACGGYKTMILATSYCSIEHSISKR